MTVRKTRSLRRFVAVAALALAALVGFGGSALAHDVLESSDPPDGAQLQAGPKQVTLTFNEPVRAGQEYNTISVVGPDGTYWTDAPAQVNGNSISAPVRDLGPTGPYTVGFRILSADGHPVSGKVTFTLTKAGNGTPAPPPRNAALGAGHSDSGGMPIWPWIAGAVVLVAVGLTLALRLGRSND